MRRSARVSALHLDVALDRLGVARAVGDQVRVGAGRHVREAEAAVAVGLGLERARGAVAAEDDGGAGQRGAAVGVGDDARHRAAAGDAAGAGLVAGLRVGVVGVGGRRVPAHAALAEHLPDQLRVLAFVEYEVGLEHGVAEVEEARLRRRELERLVDEGAPTREIPGVVGEQPVAQLPQRLAQDLAVVVLLRLGVDLAVLGVREPAVLGAEPAVRVHDADRAVDRHLAAHAGLEQVAADPHLARDRGVGDQVAPDEVVEREEVGQRLVEGGRLAQVEGPPAGGVDHRAADEAVPVLVVDDRGVVDRVERRVLVELVEEVGVEPRAVALGRHEHAGVVDVLVVRDAARAVGAVHDVAQHGVAADAGLLLEAVEADRRRREVVGEPAEQREQLRAGLEPVGVPAAGLVMPPGAAHARRALGVEREGAARVLEVALAGLGDPLAEVEGVVAVDVRPDVGARAAELGGAVVQVGLEVDLARGAARGGAGVVVVDEAGDGMVDAIAAGELGAGAGVDQLVVMRLALGAQDAPREADVAGGGGHDEVGLGAVVGAGAGGLGGGGDRGGLVEARPAGAGEVGVRAAGDVHDPAVLGDRRAQGALEQRDAVDLLVPAQQRHAVAALAGRQPEARELRAVQAEHARAVADVVERDVRRVTGARAGEEAVEAAGEAHAAGDLVRLHAAGAPEPAGGAAALGTHGGGDVGGLDSHRPRRCGAFVRTRARGQHAGEHEQEAGDGGEGEARAVHGRKARA